MWTLGEATIFRLRTAFVLAFGLLAPACEAPPEDRSREAQVVAPEVIEPTLLPLDRRAGGDEQLRAPVRPPELHTREQLDTFTQRSGALDVLLVVDDSASMADERAALATAMHGFLVALHEAGTSYRIGVTTTSRATEETSKLLGAPIDPSTPAPGEALLEQLRVARASGRREQGLEAARLALIPGANPNFLREEAALAIVFLSDEDDASFGEPAHFARFFRARKGPGNEALVQVLAFAGPLPDGCVPHGLTGVVGARAKPAPRYRAVAGATGGRLVAICDVDLAKALAPLTKSRTLLETSFPLTLPPEPASLSVYVHALGAQSARRVDADAARGYVLEENALRFAGSYVPPPRSRIEARYTIARTAAR